MTPMDARLPALLGKGEAETDRPKYWSPAPRWSRVRGWGHAAGTQEGVTGRARAFERYSSPWSGRIRSLNGWSWTQSELGICGLAALDAEGCALQTVMSTVSRERHFGILSG
jgi:hypothetical protein